VIAGLEGIVGKSSNTHTLSKERIDLD
jgi:hypothetical protein